MEQQNFDHILNHVNILRDFNISKKVSANEINQIKQMVDRVCDNSDKKTELFKKEILKNTNLYIKTHKIPGIIVKNDDNTFSWIESNNKSDSSSEEKQSVVAKTKRYKDIKHSAAKISDSFLNTEKLTKNQLAFFVICFIEMTNLSESDFDELYKRINEDTFESDAEKENEEYDDNEEN